MCVYVRGMWVQDVSAYSKYPLLVFTPTTYQASPPQSSNHPHNHHRHNPQTLIHTTRGIVTIGVPKANNVLYYFAESVPSTARHTYTHIADSLKEAVEGAPDTGTLMCVYIYMCVCESV